VSLAAAQAGRYGGPDVELGRELARRAAVAIDNARLYRDSQDAVRIRDEFLSVASHELRTPIHSLKLIMQGLAAGGGSRSPERAARSLVLAERQIERLTRLVGELLEVSRIQAGSVALQLERVDLGELVSGVAERFEAELARAGSALSIHATGALVGLWDRDGLEQVLTNLLSNAVKFGAGRPIEVTLDERPPGTARISVADHGIGVPSARIAHIFGRFERAVSARDYGGLGLGLFIVRSVVEGLGGTVDVHSDPGLGATFTVSLPLGSVGGDEHDGR
jgi:signal transduction histidine kinase